MKLSIVNKNKLVNNSQFWIDFNELTNKLDRLPQLSSDWLIPFINHRLSDSIPLIITSYIDNKLVGCLPLQKIKKKATRYWDFTVFEFLGNGPTDFFNIPAVNDSLEIKKALLKYFFETQKWDYLKLNLLPENNNINPFLQKTVVIKNAYNIKYNRSTGCHFESTNNLDKETYYNEIFKKKNKDLLKGERRLYKDNINYHINTYHLDVYNKFINNVKLYAERRKTLGQYNFYEDESYCKFLKAVCDNYEKQNSIEFSTMESDDGDVLAIQLDFIVNRVRYHWNHAFNEDYKRYSPGKILLKELLFSSIESNCIDECNHMRGLSNYKQKFTTYTSRFINYEIENNRSMTIKLTKLASKVLRLIR